MVYKGENTMKKLYELKFEELTLEQKLGLTMTMTLHGTWRTDEEKEFVYDLIKKRALGCVWIQQGYENTLSEIAKVREIADYPILIMTDAESGIGEYMVGKHNAVGTTGSERHAYAFGKAVGVAARKMGYNVVCDPVVDMRDGSMRSMGTDKEKVTELAMAMARGMHDGGVLTVGKHYPSGKTSSGVDSHMAESTSFDTKEELLDYALYPYIKLWNAGLLDGVMTKHQRFVNIDDEYPASLSKKVIDIFREQGYEGFCITDALCMMGIRAKFGDVESKALAINAGNDILLPYTRDNDKQLCMYREAYDNGLISDEALDSAVKRVLAAQAKTLSLPCEGDLTEQEVATFASINKDGVYVRKDDAVSDSIPKDGRNFFIICVKQETAVKDGKVDVDTFSNGWLRPDRIVAKIGELFPNSNYQIIHEFPSQNEMMTVLSNSLGYDNVTVMTFSEALAYTGPEHLTRRVVNLITAMQLTNRISTLIHLGNPHVLEELPHIPRVIFGGHATDSVDATLEVLAGDYPANGVPTYDFKLQ